MFVTVKHNMEVAHRLSLLPGKCQQIHGHSMEVYITIQGQPDANGVLNSIDFGALKKVFRDYIDSEWDHRLHLNGDDPWAQTIYFHRSDGETEQHTLPGLVIHDGDPTVENIAAWIGTELRVIFFDAFGYPNLLTMVEIWETETNSVKWFAT